MSYSVSEGIGQRTTPGGLARVQPSVMACFAGLVLLAAPGCGSSKREFDTSQGGAAGVTAGGAAGTTAGAAGSHKGGTSGTTGSSGSSGKGGSTPNSDAGSGGMSGGGGDPGETKCETTEYYDGKACKALTVCGANEFESVPPGPDRDRVCKSLTECTADQYAVPGTGGQDRMCVPLSVCGAGTYVSASPTGTTNRACAPCAAGTFSSQPNTAMCKAWKTCSAGETESVAPDLTSDRVCSACGTGKYSLNGTCTALTECTGSQYESKAATSTADRTCTAVSDCAPGSKQTAAPTKTTDRQCAACGANSFSTTKNADTCSSWTVCSASEYESSLPSATANRVCTALTSCAAGQRIKTAATATTNRVCEACPSGTFSTTANAATCANWTACTAGSYVSGAGSTTANQSCTTCANGYYSTTSNAGSCTQWSTCGTGQGETTAGTTTTNRVCAACTAGNYATGGKCMTCTAGTNFSSTAGATSCTACATCGWFPATACTVSANTVCTKQDTTKQDGTVNGDSSGGLVVDGAGNVWVAGTIYTSKPDVVLYKYDSSGNKVKTISIASTGSERAYGLVLDTAGNVWVGGSTDGALKAGANPNSVQMGFAARFAPDGTAKGVLQFTGNMSMFTIAAGLSADVWMTAGTKLTHITDSGGTLVNTPPSDLTGISTSATGIADAYALTVDSNGNPWLAGYTDSGQYVFKGSANGDVNSSSAKFTQFGPSAVNAQPLAMRAVGSNVWVLGKINTRYDNNDSTVPPTGFGGRDGFIVRVKQSDVTVQEVTQFGGLGNDYVNSTFLDSNGDLWVGGQTEATFGGKTSKGGWDIFATRFTLPASGAAKQTTETYLVGTDQQEYQGWVALDAAQHLWVAGSTEGQFPGGLNQGGSDIFVTQVGK